VDISELEVGRYQVTEMDLVWNTVYTGTYCNIPVCYGISTSIIAGARCNHSSGSADGIFGTNRPFGILLDPRSYNTLLIIITQ
jgi:hypothetical protein